MKIALVSKDFAWILTVPNVHVWIADVACLNSLRFDVFLFWKYELMHTLFPCILWLYLDITHNMAIQQFRLFKICTCLASILSFLKRLICRRVLISLFNFLHIHLVVCQSEACWHRGIQRWMHVPYRCDAVVMSFLCYTVFWLLSFVNLGLGGHASWVGIRSPSRPQLIIPLQQNRLENASC